jgi:hypothetical protein
MKKRIRNIIYMLAAVLLAASCEWDPIMFDESKSHVAFTDYTTSIPEEGNAMGIVVKVSALSDSPSLTVEYEFDTVGIDPEKAAFEGAQFNLLNESKTLTFTEGWGYDTIFIEPIDNEIFTGNKIFNISLTGNSADYPFGEASVHAVTLADNEHPLGKWIGTYAVEALSYGDPGAWDEAWVVTTTPIEGEIDKLSILGIGSAGTTAIIATVDKENMTITIKPGQDADAYADLGYTEGYVYYGTPELSLDINRPLEGTISEDGTITIDNFGIEVKYAPDPSYNTVWDVFNTTWNKTAKKSVSSSGVTDEKLDARKF